MTEDEPKRRSKRAKTTHGKYGEAKKPISALLSPEAKLGLQQLAQQYGVSLNELLEKLGRGQILPDSLGECSPS